jgi:hypothetical protein
VTNFKNPGHGFCAEGSHVADSRAIFENSSWFESSFDFSEHENAQFRDGRFFLTTVKLMLSWKKWHILDENRRTNYYHVPLQQNNLL